MPLLVAKCGALAGVDLLPHLGRMNEPVFRAVVQSIAKAGVELHNEIHSPEAKKK